MDLLLVEIHFPNNPSMLVSVEAIPSTEDPILDIESEACLSFIIPDGILKKAK